MEHSWKLEWPKRISELIPDDPLFNVTGGRNFRSISVREPLIRIGFYIRRRKNETYWHLSLGNLNFYHQVDRLAKPMYRLPNRNKTGHGGWVWSASFRYTNILRLQPFNVRFPPKALP